MTQANTSLWRRFADWCGTPRARMAVIGLFVVQAVLLVFVTNFGTPPDENNHWKFINYYADNSLSPIFTDQEPTRNLGDKTREVDYLYHYVMSLVVRILPFSEEAERYIVRLFSVGFGVLTFIFLAKVLRKLKLSETMTTVTILLLSQLSMVLFVSAAVNNDTLVWLGMVLGLWLLLKIWERPKLVYILGLLLLPAYGGLVKRTLLPIVLVIWVVTLVLLWRQRVTVVAEMKSAFSKQKPLVITLILLVTLGVGLSAERIGGNLITYGKVVPTCEDVQGEAACRDFWASIRAREIAERSPEPRIALPVFVGRWVWDSVKNILDIQTQWWRHEVMPPVWMTVASLATLGIGVGYGIMHSLRRIKETVIRKQLVVLGIGLVYILSHLAFNYSEYRQYGVYGLALNGRYILAGLFPVVGLAVLYWSIMLNRWPRFRVLIAVLAVGSLAIWSGLTLLLRNPQLFHG